MRTTLSVGGKKWNVSAPFGMAPVGINKIYHDRGELAVAKAAGELGLVYALSMGGSYPIENVGKTNDEGRANRVEANKNLGDENEHKVPEAPRFFQLYMPHDDEITLSLLKRAHKAGFEACILTTDTPQLGWRHDDVANSNYAFYRGIGGELGFTDPVFQKRMTAEGVDPKTDPVRAATMWIDTIWHGRAWSWEKALWARQKWQEIAGKESPFLIKGIQSASDARKAADLGFEGVVVSNHAGRQVDGAVGSLDALESVVKAVGDRKRFTVMFDSGVRGAADVMKALVMKALALGAKFVFIGRLWIWGLAIMGEEGVRHVMRSMLADFDILLNMMGVNSVKEIDGSLLESGPRVYSLLNEKSKL